MNRYGVPQSISGVGFSSTEEQIQRVEALQEHLQHQHYAGQTSTKSPDKGKAHEGKDLRPDSGVRSRNMEDRGCTTESREDLVEALQGVTPKPLKWLGDQCLCPVCYDGGRSVRISPGDGSKAHWRYKCGRCGFTGDLSDALAVEGMMRHVGSVPHIQIIEL
jgi:hypothetical protein